MAIVNEGAATAVVGYVRVSRVGARGGDSFLSPALQREEIARVAAREGLEVVEVVEELDASGGDARRPGWNRVLEMVESVVAQARRCVRPRGRLGSLEVVRTIGATLPPW